MGYIGIDFGTTNTAIVYYDERGKRILEVPCGRKGDSSLGLKKTLPSVVSFDTNGKPEHVGDAALPIQEASPTLFVDKIKRLIGRSYEQAMQDPLLHTVSYEVIMGEQTSGGQHIPLLNLGEVEKKRYRPEEIATLIFKEARNQVVRYVNDIGCAYDASRVIVTVPANFDVNRRSRIREAAIMAGFEEGKLELLNEPTASVFDAVSKGKINKNDNVLVFNIGAGTTDLAIAEVRMPADKLIVESWAVGGEAELGGTDMDIAIVDWLIEKLREDKKINKDKLEAVKDELRKYLRPRAERAKIALSEGIVEEAEIGIPQFVRTIRLARSDLEQIVKPIVERCRESVTKVLSIALKSGDIKMEDINKVILTGGPMTMPIVRTMMLKEFGERLVDGVDPMMCVARGAAVKPGALKTINPPSHSIYLSIEGLAIPVQIEEVVTVFESLPADKIFIRKVRPSEPSITIGVLQEPEKRTSANSYLSTAKYVFSFAPPPESEKDYYLACHVDEEEDKITVIVVDSQEKASRFLKDPDKYGEVPFKFRRFKDIGEITIGKDVHEMNPELLRIRETFWSKAPAIRAVLADSIQLWLGARGLLEAGYKPPGELGPMIFYAQNFFFALRGKIDERLSKIAEKKMNDQELDAELGKLTDETLTSKDFGILRNVISTREWKDMMTKWVIPANEVHKLVEMISTMKIDAKKTMDEIRETPSKYGDIQRIEQLLTELDSIQNHLYGRGDIQVYSNAGRQFIEGKNRLQQLRSWITEQ